MTLKREKTLAKTTTTEVDNNPTARLMRLLAEQKNQMRELEIVSPNGPRASSPHFL